MRAIRPTSPTNLKSVQIIVCIGFWTTPQDTHQRQKKTKRDTIGETKKTLGVEREEKKALSVHCRSAITKLLSDEPRHRGPLTQTTEFPPRRVFKIHFLFLRPRPHLTNNTSLPSLHVWVSSLLACRENLTVKTHRCSRSRRVRPVGSEVTR